MNRLEKLAVKGLYCCALLVLSLILQYGICSAEDTLPRAAVLDFENYAGEEMSDFVKSFPSMLMTGLGVSEGYKTVERRSVEKAAGNFAFELSGMVDSDRIIEVGQWLGATHLISGSMSGTAGEYRLDCRLIDAREGYIIKTFYLQVKKEGLLSAADELGGMISVHMEGGDTAAGAVKGKLEVNFKLTLAPLAAGPIYYHRVKLYVNNIYMGMSDIIKKENNLHEIFSIQLPPGSYAVRLMHGYVDQKNGKWESDYEIQPGEVAIKVKSDFITSLDYEYNTGLFKNKYIMSDPRTLKIFR